MRSLGLIEFSTMSYGSTREVVALWAGILAEEKQREAEQEALHQAALEPIWKRELKRLREPGQQLELPLLPAELVLPTECDALFTGERLSAFLSLLAFSARARGPQRRL